MLLVGFLMSRTKESNFLNELNNGRGRVYADLFANAEKINHLPENLVARVAYQESRFRPDIITGETTSRAGAVGIMQIVPRWHPTVDPTDPVDSIAYAGTYLKYLRNQAGSWELALAAYNWGIGNLNEKGIQAAPDETINYVAEISADVRLA